MKIATICYLPPGADASEFHKYVTTVHPPCLEKAENAEVVHYFLSSNPGGLDRSDEFKMQIIREPIYFQSTNGIRPTDLIASQVFLEAIRLATSIGADYFFYYETDCRFRCPGWFDHVLGEFLSSRIPLLAGTPVSWHPWCIGKDHSKRMQEFAYRCCSVTGVPMAFEGPHVGPARHAFYPNGALAFYNTEFVGSVFGHALHEAALSDRTTPSYRDMLVGIRAFDLYIGNRLFELFGSSMFDNLIPLSTVYSGCASHHVTLSERLAMLRTTGHRKYAVHHIKPSELGLAAFIDLVTPKPPPDETPNVKLDIKPRVVVS